MTQEEALVRARDLTIFTITFWVIAYAIYGFTRIDWLRAETIGLVYAVIYGVMGVFTFSFAMGWIWRILFRPRLFH
ncbi:MAG: hypothetical protein WD874_01895 [Parcubacteria group bacterium]